MAGVSWTANGLYTEEADSTRTVVDKRESPFTEQQAFRLTERGAFRAQRLREPREVDAQTDFTQSASIAKFVLWRLCEFIHHGSTNHANRQNLSLAKND